MPDTPPPAPGAPSCHRSGCTAPPAVQWRRRPTPTELADVVAAEQERRRMAVLLADTAVPAPVFGPLPTSADTTLAVLACATHAITLDAAAHVHGADCTGCNCTPEPLPPQDPDPLGGSATTLPTGWVL